MGTFLEDVSYPGAQIDVETPSLVEGGLVTTSFYSTVPTAYDLVPPIERAAYRFKSSR
jgi:hypothetical protein